MSTVLMDLSHASLAGAIEANLNEFLGTSRQWPRAEVHTGPELAWLITSYPFSLFNSLFRTRLTAESADAAIEAAITRGRTRGVSLLWWTGPASRPVDFGARLERYGFHSGEIEHGMAVDLQAFKDTQSDPAGLTIEPVQELETLKTWCHTSVTGFGFPVDAESVFLDWFTCISLGSAHLPLSHYLGRLNGEAVATSSLFYASGVAGIYNVSTLPDARRRGIGAAMTLAPLRAARSAGYRAGILQASDMGAPVYRELGFQKYCDIGIYEWDGNPASSLRYESTTENTENTEKNL
jgi:GNAT superfamily N-acetyltransferase